MKADTANRSDASPDMPLKVSVGARDAEGVKGSFDPAGHPHRGVHRRRGDADLFLPHHQSRHVQLSEGEPFNSGFVPFSQDAVYVTYFGNGATSFNYR